MVDGDEVRILEGGRKWSTLKMAGREWRHDDRLLAAFRRTVADEAATFTATLVDKDPAPKAETEVPWRLWLVPPGRGRAEFALGTEMLTVVVDGDRWWSWSPLLGPRAGGTSMKVAMGPGLTLVEPRRLLPWLEGLTTVGRRNVAGREGIAVQARPVDPEVRGRLQDEEIETMRGVSADLPLCELGEGADDYELVVDSEIGVLLRSEARLDRQAFRIIEVDELAFDESIDAGLLRLHPPHGGSFALVEPE